VIKFDLVNQPPHYRQSEIECIDAIKSALTPDEYRGYLKGNCLKYTWRERFKNGLQDIQKMHWYATELITFLSTAASDDN
jgi:hypothetical protein